MTVSSDLSYISYAGDGATLSFPIPFYFLKNTDLVVSVVNADGTVQAYVLDTNFTVTGAGNPSGGTLTLIGSAIAVGKNLTIDRDPPVTQETAYQANDPFPAAEHEKALDKLTMLAQRLSRTFFNALHFPLQENIDGTLPKKSSRASNILGFDPLGQITMLPIPASVGAGDMRVDTFTAGVDFTAGVTTQLTLSRAPGNAANLEIFFDPLYQGPDQWTVVGSVVTFTSPIPAGVQKVFARSGTTLSTQIPPNGSVGDAQLAWLGILNRVVDSITALRALDKLKYSRAFVTGYYAKGDGGGGAYYLDPLDTTSVDNGGTIIAAADGGRWKLIHNGTVDAKQFGARPNSVETAARIQAAWDATDVGTVVHSDGNYLIGTTLVPPTFRKDLIWHKNAKFLANVNGLTFIKSTISAYYVRFFGPWFHGNGKTSVVGMDMTNMRLFSGLLHPKFESLDTGFIGRNGCFGLLISHPTAEAVPFPVVFVANNSSSVIDCPNFDNGVGVGGTGLGIGVTVQGGGTNLGAIIRGGYIQGYQDGVSDNGTGTTVSDVYFENCTDADILGGSGGRQGRYENCNHWGSVGPAAYKLRNTDAVVIWNPTMGSGGRTVLFDVDNTNSNASFFISGSNASLNTPTGSLVNMAQIGARSNQSFTPTVAGSTVAGVGTYTAQNGRISLHAGYVEVAMTIGWTSHTGSGNIVINGIPAGFAPGSFTPRRIAQLEVGGIAYTGPKLYAYMNGTGTQLSVLQVDTTGVESLLALPATGTMHIKLSYDSNA